MFALPRRFAVLFHHDDSERQRCLRDMKDADVAFRRCELAQRLKGLRSPSDAS